MESELQMSPERFRAGRNNNECKNSKKNMTFAGKKNPAYARMSSFRRQAKAAGGFRTLQSDDADCVGLYFVKLETVAV